MAEASGEHEELEGYPLRPYAQAGSIHSRVLRSLGISRKQTLAFNVLSCRPSNNKLDGEWYEQQAITNCSVHRLPVIDAFRRNVATNPAVRESVIVALGATAFRTLTGLAGDKLGISYTRGYPIRTPYGLVVGTFHPAEVRRKLKHLGVLTEDYAKAFMYARDGFREFPKSYDLYPTVRDVQDFRDRVRKLATENRPDVWLSFDFETNDIIPNMPKGTWPGLQSIQYSLDPGRGIFLDINRDTWPIVAELQASKLKKVTHNGWDFDVPLSNYWKLPIGGVVDDSLWMFHHFQPDLVMEDAGAEAETDFRFSTSASLQFVASFFGMDFIWKHLRTSTDLKEQRFYGVADVDATSRIVAPGNLPDRMRALGVWAGYERYVREFYPILKRMAERGLPIDRKSQFEFAAELEKIEIVLDKKIQSVHPDNLKFCAPKEGYVNGPKRNEKVREVFPATGGPSTWEWYDDGEDVNYPGRDNDPLDADEGDRIITGVWRPMVQRTFVVTPMERQRCVCGKYVANIGKKGQTLTTGKWYHDVTCGDCWGKGFIRKQLAAREETRWVRLLPFRPSNKQLLVYIHSRGHKPPKVKGKVTTAAKGIQDLAKKTKDPLYQSILDIRTISKISSTYVTGKGWMDYGADGKPLPIEQQPARVYPTPTLGPATGQTSMRRPNTQNAPKHTRNENLKHLDLANRFRKLIKTTPGRRIWEFDLKSAHALTLGLEAKCPDYMRLAKLDVHTYMASHLAYRRKLIDHPIDLTLSDGDLKLALKAMRKMRWNCSCAADVVAHGKVEPTCRGIHLEADIRDTQAKPAILGYGFGMMGEHLYRDNIESFKSAEEAQDVLNLIDQAFDPLKVYRSNVLTEAHEKHHLISRGGFMRWFWHVYDFVYDRFDEKNYKVKHGEDAEDAMAFRPANTAFVYMRDAELRLETLGVNEVFNWINVVHDSNVFESQIERPMVWLDPFVNPFGVYASLPAKDDELAMIVKREMERPQMLLGDPDVAPNGMAIECDVKVGNNWSEMEEVKL